MPIGIGTRLGGYEILSALGKGGMGEVWRARDAKLGREVAIKTLPEEFARDEDRLVRFEREARVLASLNHQNIAAIYGLEESGGTRFIVLELVEGETLADVLKRGPVPSGVALQLGLQIATAVEAAHEKGVVHRDLKPANIKVTPEGKVKVLDFGLAKAFQVGEPNLSDSNSPTLSMAATAKGIILGTAAYMSPEQVRGMTVDTRTDVWSFGCVLYEMLTGRQTFRGEMVSDILASVLARDPDFTLLPGRLHPRLQETLDHCLEKDPKRRWQAIGDVRMELERLSASGRPMAPAASVVSAPKEKLRLVLPWVAAAVILTAAVGWVLRPARLTDPRPVARFEYELPEAQALRNMGWPVVAVSPDGRHFVYNTTNGLFIRSLDSLTSRPIPGTEETLSTPFFSPDGEWVAYFPGPGNDLRKIAIAGGAPVHICRLTPPPPSGATWGADGTILFAQDEGVMRVSANGGTPELVIKMKQGEVARSPSMLPDGKTILYTSTRGLGSFGDADVEIVAQAMDSSEAKVLFRGGQEGRYVPTGHLVYVAGPVLFAVPFDVEMLEVKGKPVALIQGIQRGTSLGSSAANYGFSNQGMLVYLSATEAAPASQSTLAIVDRTGAVRPLAVPSANYRNPRVSPDGRSLAVETIAESGQSSVSIYDLTGATTLRRLTQEGNNIRPLWTRDGKSVVYASDREKAHGIYRQPADGSRLPERLTTAEEGVQHYPESWSPDGRVLSFVVVRTPTGASWELWTLAMDGEKKEPALFYDVPSSNEFGSVFSVDGKWIAYASNEGGGEVGIYVQPFPPTGVKYGIARDGGAWPVWSPGGAELIYRLNVSTTNIAKLKALALTTQPVPSVTTAMDLPIRGFRPVAGYRDYDILPNGREFLMVLPVAQAPAGPPPRPRIHIVLNWFEELKARVPIP